MSAFQPSSEEAHPLFIKEAEKLKAKIDSLISKIQQDKHFNPSREEIGKHAKTLIDLMNQYHDQIYNHENFLKAALIDLTAIPEMEPQMQKLSFLTSLKEASKELQLFLKCY